MDINDASDYIITRVLSAEESLNNLKLQKILYYVQAWHLAFYGKTLFNGRFQAWVHGPVSREIYDRFQNKSLYSPILESDINESFKSENLVKSEMKHIDVILETYAPFEGYQLEEMTHAEEPWIKAREGYRASARCEESIDENLMQTFYASRIT